MINYQNIADSIKFYETHDFKRIESPWTVTKQIAHITKPKERASVPDFQIGYNNKLLVASGEQSFLYLYLKGFIPKGRYQTITPCFRYEEFDDFHTKYFMKNELMITDDISKYRLEFMIEKALTFFGTKLDLESLNVVPQKSGDNYDIEYKGIELGSYGIRSCKFLVWVYGTGCAEPRLSNCQEFKL